LRFGLMELGNAPGSLFGIRKSILVAVLFLLAAVLWVEPAGSAKQEGGDSGLLPATFLRWPDRGSEHGILVDKSQQRVFVYRKNDLTTPVKTYTCSTGENEGKKARQNDRKTPEGIYFFVNVYEQKDLAPIYGIRAFPLDYPNPMDRREGRDGYGIWFHGLNKPLKPRDTNGCVALENQDIDDLTSFVRLHDTPIIIASKPEMVDPAKFQKEKEELEKVVEGWRKAWESKQIDKYMSYYSPRFTDGKTDWKGYKEYKARLARQYKDIQVKLDNLAIYKNDGLAMATFYQNYSTALFNSKGQKRLFLQQNSKEWKIVSEHFDEGPEPKSIPLVVAKKTPPEEKPAVASKPTPAEEKPVVASKPTATEERPGVPPKKDEKPAAAPKKTAVSAQVEIRAFIEGWRKAWEKKDLKTYISCYDSSFSSRGMNLKEWKQHRENLNEQHQSLNVELKDVKIKEKPGDLAIVTFVQDYRADDYRDVGVKNILLTKRGPHWKIKMEEWRPLKKKPRG
jgi:murein L,D-transpeptidase YafK